MAILPEDNRLIEEITQRVANQVTINMRTEMLNSMRPVNEFMARAYKDLYGNGQEGLVRMMVTHDLWLKILLGVGAVELILTIVLLTQAF